MNRSALISQQKDFIDRLRVEYGIIRTATTPFIRPLQNEDLEQIKSILDYWYLNYAATILSSYDFSDDIQKYLSLMSLSLEKNSSSKYYVLVSKTERGNEIIVAVLGYSNLGHDLIKILREWFPKQKTKLLLNFLGPNLSIVKGANPEDRFDVWLEQSKPIEMRSLYKHPLVEGVHNTGNLMFDHVIQEARKSGHLEAAFYSRMMWAYAKRKVYDTHSRLVDIGVYPVRNIPAQIYLIDLK